MQEKGFTGGNKRMRIGLLTATITDPFSNSLAKGAVYEAEKLGCDLFIFPGKYLGLEDTYAANDALYEYQYNALFDIAAEAGLDYIINAVGTIGYALNEEEKKEFVSRFAGTPQLTVAAEAEGCDYILFDNSSGICEAVDFLADEGRKCICMMIGDPNSMECQLRYKAYRDSLERRGLYFDERYVHTCILSEECFPETEDLVATVPEMDAVICVNDAIAREMIRALRGAGYRIGADVAVVGFDDRPFAAELEPPLATVKADAELLGRRAVEKAVHHLAGVPDEEHLVPTMFIPRQSASILGELYNSPEAVFVGDFGDIVSHMKEYISNAQSVSKDMREPVRRIFERIMKTIINAFLREDKQAGQSELIDALDAADSFFGLGCLSVDMLIRSYSIIDGGYKWCLERCPKQNIPMLRKLYEHFYRRMSMEMIQNHRALQLAFRERTHIDNIFIRDTLMFGGDLSTAYGSVVKQMSYLGADTGYIYLLKEPVSLRMRERFDPCTEWEFPVYFYGQNRFVIPEGERAIDIKSMFGNEHLPNNRRFTVIAADLYSNEQQYGVALLEPASCDFFDELELVVYQLSAAVRTLRLLKQQEEMLAELHSRNLALDSLSRIDELTGLYNRRGFYVEAEKLVEANKGRELIVCYADMDNLKLVNDRYGHSEGDYALRLLAGCMRNVFGAGAVVARMGGDEYAAIIVKDGLTIKELESRKEAFLAMSAGRDHKPYKVNISMGMIESVCNDSYDLGEVLELADGVLYNAKKKRKKEI